MKKLLVGLLILGSFSLMAQDYTCFENYDAKIEKLGAKLEKTKKFRRMGIKAGVAVGSGIVPMLAIGGPQGIVLGSFIILGGAAIAQATEDNLEKRHGEYILIDQMISSSLELRDEEAEGPIDFLHEEINRRFWKDYSYDEVAYTVFKLAKTGTALCPRDRPLRYERFLRKVKRSLADNVLR